MNMTLRLEAIEKSLGTLVEKVVEATYKSILSSRAFVTQEENMQLQTDVTIITKKLDALMEVIQLRENSSINSPPRKTQRFEDHSFDDDTTTPTSSAQLTCEDAMSEREE